MNTRSVGLIAGFALFAGIAIGDMAEPQIAKYKDYVLISLSGGDTRMDEAVVTLSASIPKSVTCPYDWELDYGSDFLHPQAAVSFKNDPANGVTVTVYVGKRVPQEFSHGAIAEIRTVHVVYPANPSRVFNAHP
jgi:hypothetical protein